MHITRGGGGCPYLGGQWLNKIIIFIPMRVQSAPENNGPCLNKSEYSFMLPRTLFQHYFRKELGKNFKNSTQLRS